MKIYFFAFCSVLICLSVMACGMFDDEIIKYEVTGTASSVRITMHNDEGNIEQLDDVSVPWSKGFEPYFESSDEFDGFTGIRKYYYSAYISARNNGDSGSVIVKLYRNNHLIETATSKGAYVTATVSKKIQL
jgi:hypothetical protein